MLELLVEDLGFKRGAVLEDGDGSDVGQGLGRLDVGATHISRLDVEQVEGADDRAPQPHGQGMDGVETGGKGLSSETGPAARGHGEVCLDGRLAASVTVEARSFFGLQLEELQYPHGFAGGSHDPQLAVGPASMSPAAPTPSTSTQRSASLVSSSTTSKSATNVSASSTRALASSTSLGTVPPIMSVPSIPGLPGLCE